MKCENIFNFRQLWYRSSRSQVFFRIGVLFLFWSTSQSLQIITYNKEIFRKVVCQGRQIYERKKFPIADIVWECWEVFKNLSGRLSLKRVVLRIILAFSSLMSDGNERWSYVHKQTCSFLFKYVSPFVTSKH